MKHLLALLFGILFFCLPLLAQSQWSLGVEAGYVNPLRVLGNDSYQVEGITLSSNNPYAEALRFTVFGEQQLSARWSVRADLGFNYFTYNNSGLFAYQDEGNLSQLGSIANFGELRLAGTYKILPGVKLIGGINNWIFMPTDEPEGNYIDVSSYPSEFRSEAIRLNRRRDAALALHEGRRQWMMTGMAGLRFEFGRLGVGLQYERSLTNWMNSIELFGQDVGVQTDMDRFYFTVSCLLVKNR